LPSDKEWQMLVDFVGSEGGKKLKAKEGWDEGGNGTDEYGFSALPGGGGNSDGSFSSVGEDGYWWKAKKWGESLLVVARRTMLPTLTSGT